MSKRRIIISCEHAAHYIPKDFSHLFLGSENVIQSHRGWDPGALKVAKYLAKNLEAPLFIHKPSRLLIEVNRSIGHSQLFSEYTNHLDESLKDILILKYYNPYRSHVEEKIEQLLAEGGQVLHLSIHSFTPILNGIERLVDVGILFDESREGEVAFSTLLKEYLQNTLVDMSTLLNCPYQGADDGFTTYLRKKYSESQYLGIELEINQKHVNTEAIRNIQKAISHGVSNQKLHVSV